MQDVLASTNLPCGDQALYPESRAHQKWWVEEECVTPIEVWRYSGIAECSLVPSRSKLSGAHTQATRDCAQRR